LLVTINSRPFQKIPGSRLTQFEKLDKPALKPLPAIAYEFAEWKKVSLGSDYHIELDQHYYSVPYTFIKKSLEVRYTSKTVEIFYRAKRIASHVRQCQAGHSTLLEHMPKAHQKYAEWTSERIVDWAKKIGAKTVEFVEKTILSKAHPQLAFRSCLGILRLSKTYGEQRLELACTRALIIGAYSYTSIESILKNNLDQQPITSSQDLTTTKQPHENVRGGDYFM
jgi:transposase